MSNIDRAVIVGLNEAKTRLLGGSLADSLYLEPCTIDLIGDLGAGKTTFVKGFATGLGVTSPVTSPTFALEERHGNRLCHIDLCRLKESDAERFLRHSDDFPGIRIIEWANRSASHDADIVITIADGTRDTRDFKIVFRDIRIPTDQEIETIWDEVGLPLHIRDHIRAVTKVADQIVSLLQLRGIVVRPGAVHAAAMLHDVLRFVDFKTFSGDQFFTPDRETQRRWKEMKERYGTPHEAAAARLLQERGFPHIGEILRAHRGKQRPEIDLPVTIEQKVLTYADKRVDLDTLVSLETRFVELIKRHEKNGLDLDERAWQQYMRQLEQSLFPDGAPF